MRLGVESVGRWGLAVLALTGVVGVVLAVHGWSARHNGLPHASLGSTGSSHAPHPASTPSTTPSTTAPAVGPTAPGSRPLLSKQSYASYAFQVWPGNPSSAAKAALIGLTVSVKKEGSVLLVTAGVSGQPRQPARRYVDGARVYVVEASLGDDSGNTDYNLGDDALVVTDANGGIVQ